MEQNYNKEIERMELEGRKLAQSHSLNTLKVEVLRFENRIREAKQNIAGLEIAIKETDKLIADLS